MPAWVTPGLYVEQARRSDDTVATSCNGGKVLTFPSATASMADRSPKLFVVRSATRWLRLYGKPRSCQKVTRSSIMAAVMLGEALPLPQKHDADERFAEDQYQHQVAPRHCKEARKKAARLALF
jgi:hypothetical protein